MQHRFAQRRRAARPRGRQPADRRAVGAARRPGARPGLGRPAARRPGPGAADVRGAAGHRGRGRRARPGPPDELRPVRGQARCATTPGQVRRPRCCPRTRRPARGGRAVLDADWVVLGPARGSPACCRTCWCPSWPPRWSRPRPGGCSSSTWRRSPGRPTASHRTSTSRCSPRTRLSLLLDVVLADTTPPERRPGRPGAAPRCSAPRLVMAPTWPRADGTPEARSRAAGGGCTRSILVGCEYGRTAMAMTAAVKDELSRLHGHRSPAAARPRSPRCCGSPAACTCRAAAWSSRPSSTPARRPGGCASDITEVFGHPADVARAGPGGLRKGNRYLVRVCRAARRWPARPACSTAAAVRCAGLPPQVVVGRDL